MAACSVVGCGRPCHGRGLCSTHYAGLPDQRAKQAALRKRPEVKARRKKYAATYYRIPEVNALDKARKASPVYREKYYHQRRTIKSCFNNGKSTAKRCKRTWEISFEEFTILRSKTCTYCQFPLPPTGSGLDRIDNSKGYTLDNVVPCCHPCNIARSDNFTHEEMLREIGPVLRKVKLARSPPLLYTPETSPSIEVSNVQCD